MAVIWFALERAAMKFDTVRSNQRPVTVPRSTKSRHTANDVLKSAGLPKAF